MIVENAHLRRAKLARIYGAMRKEAPKSRRRPWSLAKRAKRAEMDFKAANSEMQRQLDRARSPFDAWVIMNGLSGPQAAKILGTSLRSIVNYSNGSITPPYSIRVLMTIINDGKPVPKAWPEDDLAEKDVQ